jgi:uncharacterized protein
LSYTPPSRPPLSASDDQLYATLATFLNIIPLVPALVFYLAFRHRGAKIGAQSTENLNWTIGVTIALVAINIASGILAFIPFLGGVLGFLLGIVAFAVWVLNLVFSIIGGVKVIQGGLYTYPWSYRFVR